MVKVKLVEGVPAYVVGMWVVMPRTEKGAQIVGECVLIGPGIKLVISEAPASLADRLNSDLGGTPELIRGDN